MDEIAGGISSPLLLAFPEILFLEDRVGAANVFLNVQHADYRFLARPGDCRNQPRPRREKRAEPIPVPLLSGRTGNDLVQGLNDAVDRIDVLLKRGWCLGLLNGGGGL